MSKKSYSKRLSLDYPKTKEVLKKDPVGYPRIVKKVVNGVVVNSVEFTLDDERDNVVVNDFAIQNLLAAGVQLKEVKFSLNPLEVADKAIDNIQQNNGDSQK